MQRRLNSFVWVFVCALMLLSASHAAAQVSTNPENNGGTVTLTGKDLDALSDDPDELQSELQALAGPSTCSPRDRRRTAAACCSRCRASPSHSRARPARAHYCASRWCSRSADAAAGKAAARY